MAGSDRKRAPSDAEAFVKQLLVTYKAVRLYPPSSSIPRQNAQLLLEKLRALLRRSPEMRMVVTRDGLFFEGLQALPGQQAYVSFAREAFRHALGEVRFHAGVTTDEVLGFLVAIAEEPAVVSEAGGFSAWLWDHDIHQITVGEMETKIVDADETVAAEEPGASGADDEVWPPEPDVVDKMLQAVRDIQGRDQRILVRFLLEPKLVGQYLQHVAAQASADPVSKLADRLFAISRAASNEMDEEQSLMGRSAAEAIMSLDAETRKRLLAEHVLPRARIDDATAQILRQIDLKELCAALAEGFSDDEASREGLARALQNLILIGAHARESVARAAAEALEGGGVPAPRAAEIAQGAISAHVEAQPARVTSGKDALSDTIRLVDMALAEMAAGEGGAGLQGLRREAADGFTDATVFGTVIRLLMVERRPSAFASLLALVEDGLPLLLDRSEHEAAAAAVEGLVGLCVDETVPVDLRKRVSGALAGLATGERIARLCATARHATPGTPLHESCVRLIRLLGSSSIDPLLEVLASEQDMAVRKSLVEMISSLAGDHIEQLGARVEDGRWFFVRNVVAILGSTRDARALPYLARTLRHADARVRRETIRALASIKDRYAEELMIAGLEDDDAQNVVLAARYIGTLGMRGADQALLRVARGDGQSSREVGPRVEAIESLARLRAFEAVPVLEQLASRRGGLLRGQRDLEVAAAAAAALATLRGASVGGGT